VTATQEVGSFTAAFDVRPTIPLKETEFIWYKDPEVRLVPMKLPVVWLDRFIITFRRPGISGGAWLAMGKLRRPRLCHCVRE